jgi:DNA-binding MarR family transcriptional regulator
MGTRRGGQDEDLDTMADSVISAGHLLIQVTGEALERLAPQINLTDFRALTLLDRDGPIRLIDIAALLEVTPTTATRLADRLSALGLVERVRQTDDRRAIQLAIASPGRRLVAKVLDRRRHAVSALLRGSSVADRTAALRLLDRINQLPKEHEATV